MRCRVRTPRPAAAARPHARAGGVASLGVLVALAVVSTAAAPGVITLRRGDTLSELALRHGTTTAALRAANRLSGDRIYAGETLTLPAGRPAPVRTEERRHVVAEGENATVVARRYGVAVEAVVSRNALPASGLVRPGQVLLVPVTVTGPPAATAPAPAAAGSVRASAAAHRAQLARTAVPSREQVRRTLAATARRYGVDVSFALAIAYNESGFQQRVVSPVDAIGVMQVLPSTGRNLDAVAGRHLDLLDTSDNITAGVLLLRQLRRSTGSDDMTLASYYQGLGSIARQGILPQTEQYIRTVNVLRPRFAQG